MRPFVRPDTTTGLDGLDPPPAAPPLLDVHDAVKLVIAPPLLGPGVNATLPPPSVCVAVPIVGASGTPAGTVRSKNR